MALLATVEGGGRSWEQQGPSWSHQMTTTGISGRDLRSMKAQTSC